MVGREGWRMGHFSQMSSDDIASKARKKQEERDNFINKIKELDNRVTKLEKELSKLEK